VALALTVADLAVVAAGCGKNGGAMPMPDEDEERVRLELERDLAHFEPRDRRARRTG